MQSEILGFPTDLILTVMIRYIFFGIFIFSLFACSSSVDKNKIEPKDPLPSWNEGPSKQSIMQYVENSVVEGPDYISEQDRIAVFDNDGTLWAEQPIYFQIVFMMDRIREMAVDHPEWLEEQPFKAVLENDMDQVLHSGKEDLAKLIYTSHANLSAEEFSSEVKKWIDSARHPSTGQLYKNMVYQPMIELLEYLRQNGYKTFIVSGGGMDFMRVFAEEVYKIPPYQVIGSSLKARFDTDNNQPRIVKIPEIEAINDKEGKPVGIHRHIGRKPVMAFGNSDGDLQMLQWTATSKINSLMVYVHHTDEAREWAYDRGSKIGALDKGLDEALKNGWTIVDMKKDWKRIYPFN